MARDRDDRARLVGEAGRVGAVHVSVLAADRDDRHVGAVGLNGLGDSLHAARVTGVVEDVGAVAEDVADRLGSTLVVGGNGPER